MSTTRPIIFAATDEIAWRERTPLGYPLLDYGSMADAEKDFNAFVDSIPMLASFRMAARKTVAGRRKLPPKAETWPSHREIADWTGDDSFERSSIVAVREFCTAMDYIPVAFANTLVDALLFEQALTLLHTGVATDNVMALGKVMRTMSALYFARQWMQLKDSSILAGLTPEAQDLLAGSVALFLAKEVDGNMIFNVSRHPVMNGSVDIRRFIAAAAHAPRSIWAEKRATILQDAAAIARLDLPKFDQNAGRRVPATAQESMAEAAGFRIPDVSPAGEAAREISQSLDGLSRAECIRKASCSFTAFLLRCIARYEWISAFQENGDHIYAKASSLMICKAVFGEADCIESPEKAPPFKSLFWQGMPRAWLALCRLMDHPTLRSENAGDARIRFS